VAQPAACAVASAVASASSGRVTTRSRNSPITRFTSTPSTSTPIPATVGTGPDCHDPDADGVVDELTEGQLTATTVYVMMQPAPVRSNPTDAAARYILRRRCFHSSLIAVVLTDAAGEALAPEFAADPGVMYELYNEPQNEATAAGWDAWQHGANGSVGA